MTLPPDFVFNQGNLQDYVDCKRRFQLRHLLRLPWPAVEAEPQAENEDRLRRGLAFHRLIHQHALDFPEGRLLQVARAQGLEKMFLNYLRHGPSDLPQDRYPEAFLSAPLAGHQVLAKYDLLAIEPGRRAVIVDWKTSPPRTRSWLAPRMQTRVYRYLLARAGEHLYGGRVVPESIEMVYWFAAEPAQSVRFGYDRSQFEADEAALVNWIQEIEQLSESEFELSEDRNRCGFCSYRSLCERGDRPGRLPDFDEEAIAVDNFDLDWEQIAELEF